MPKLPMARLENGPQNWARKKRPRPRPVRVRPAFASSTSIVRPASGPRPLPFFPGLGKHHGMARLCSARARRVPPGV
eukprot:gene6298-biopygen16378